MDLDELIAGLEAVHDEALRSERQEPRMALRRLKTMVHELLTRAREQTLTEKKELIP